MIIWSLPCAALHALGRCDAMIIWSLPCAALPALRRCDAMIIWSLPCAALPALRKCDAMIIWSLPCAALRALRRCDTKHNVFVDTIFIAGTQKAETKTGLTNRRVLYCFVSVKNIERKNWHRVNFDLLNKQRINCELAKSNYNFHI